VDLINQSRNYILQRKINAENSLGVRLTHARWLIIVGLFAQNHLTSVLTMKSFALNNADTILASYIALNLVIWLASHTFAKGFKLLAPASLCFDVVLSLIICWAAASPIFFFALVPAFLMLLMLGIWEGVAAFVLVIGANLAFIYAANYDLIKGQTPLWPQVFMFGGLMLAIGLSAYLIVQDSTPLLRVQDKMLEEALARANEANLLEMQNRAKALYRVTNTLSATLDYEKVVDSILEELEKVFDVTVGAILIFDQSLAAMRVVNCLRLSPAEQATPVEMGNGLIKQILLKGDAVLIVDRNQAETLEELRHVFPSLDTCRSVLITPLRAGFEVFGFVLIASHQEDSYGTSDLELMATMTTTIVIAMQNARLYRNLLDDRNKILSREEELRHELARNLHDGPAQAVAAFSMQAEYIRRLLKVDPDRATEELILLGKQSQQTSKEIRNLLFGLRPLVLESQGLAAALEQFAGRSPVQADEPQVHFSVTDFDERVDGRVESTIFTILQEAVNNARKHSQAKNIWLHLETRAGYIVASAQDDGKGFDIAAVDKSYDQRGSLGLTNMRERAMLVGGTCSLASTPGKGTSVIIRVPLN